MGYFNATLVRIAISEVLRSKAEQNLRGGFREAAAGYSVLSDVIKSFCFDEAKHYLGLFFIFIIL